MITPRFTAGVQNLSISLEFEEHILKPVDGSTSVSSLTLSYGAIFLSSKGGFKFPDTYLTMSFTPSYIGNTGIAIDFSNAILDFEEDNNIPQVTAAGYDPEFKGVYIQQASITLPALFSNDSSQPNTGLSIVGQDLIIGTGGFSGTIGLEKPNEADLFYKKIGDFGIGLNSFDITFLQNSITGCSIDGFLTIPGFQKNNTSADATIGIKAAFDTQGNFKISADSSQVLDDIGVKDVFTVSVNSLTVEQTGSRFYVEVSGSIDIIATVSFADNLLPKGIEIDRLRIWDDGSFEFVGGVVFPSKPIHFKLGPVELDITSISFGTEERGGRQYAYFGFDAALNVDPGGVEARGNGIKFYFSIDGGSLDTFFRIEGIGIDIILPNTSSKENAALILKGFLSVTDSPAGESYVGSVSAELPQVGIAASVSMAYTPSLPAFAVDMQLSLPAPIPLGPTGLGIYAFRGLVGQRYVASKTAINLNEDASWFDYYKADPLGVSLQKFSAEEGFSLGAGVQVGTATDSGRTFNANVFFLLSLPKVFLLEGRGAILKKRAGLDTTNEPPFYAMLAISPESVEAGFGVNLNFPDDGQIAKIQGAIELGFFFRNASAWYLNVGRETPEAKRVQAEILTLFQAYFFMMFNNSGIRAGAGASWSFNKTYGPAKISAGASLDLRSSINFNPTQLGGSIAAAAHLRVSVFKFGFGFQLKAGFSAEAPKPFIIAGYFSLIIELPWPFKDLKISIDFVWSFNKSYNLDEVPIFDPNDAVKAINILTLETFSVHVTDTLPSGPEDFKEYVIPMDSYIDVEFLKPLKPSSHSSLAKIGGITSSPSYSEMVPPQKGKQLQVRHEFTLENFNIFCWNPQSNNWESYDVYKAMLPGEDEPSHPDLSPLDEATLENMKYGFWQSIRPNHYNRIRVLGQTPFSYMQQMTGTNATEDFGFSAEDIFCEDDPIPPSCINFDTPGAYGFVASESGNRDGVIFTIEPEDANKVAQVKFGLSNALKLLSGNTLQIDFDETVTESTLKLSTLHTQKNVVIKYFSQIPNGVNYNGLQQYSWNQIHSKTLSQSQLNSPVSYNNSGGIDRIIIGAPSCEENICTLTAEGFIFFNMLKQMLDDEYLNLGGTLGTATYGAFFTVLFPSVSGETPIEYTVENETNLDVQGYLSGESLENCVLNISVLTPGSGDGFSYTDVIQLINPRPNDNEPNSNIFLIDALLQDSQIVTLQVESCIALTSCEQKENRCYLLSNAYTLLFEEMLQDLINEGLIMRSDSGSQAQIPEGIFPEDFCNMIYEGAVDCGSQNFYIKYSYPTAGEITNVQSGFFVAEDYLNSDPLNGCYFSLVLPEGYRFDQVDSISNLQIAPQNPNPTTITITTEDEGIITKEIYHFTATVQIGGQSVELTGSTCLRIFDCIDQCSTFLHELCYLKEADANYNLNIPSQSQINSQVAAIQKAHTETLVPIWRPHTTYAITAKTRDSLSGPDTRTYDTDIVIGFKTEGPSGFFNQGVHPFDWGNLSPEQKEQVKLKDLKYYLDYEKSYPSPSGNVLNAKPLYFVGPEINLFYIKNYLSAMYNSWSAYLGNDELVAYIEVNIYDPRPNNSQKETLDIRSFKRVDTDTAPVPKDAQAMMNLSSNGAPCAELGSIVPPEFKISVNPDQLEPEKMYSVVVSAVYEGQAPESAEIFRFNFQTSRYGSFEDHLSTFDLGDNVKAIYEISVNGLTSQSAVIQDVLNGSLNESNSLHAEYANDFEKIVTGIVKLSDGSTPLSNTSPPTNIEVNILKDGMTLCALWLRSPEPLNDPRLPITEKLNSLDVSVGGSPLSGLNFIYSKDMSEVFITTNNSIMPTGAYEIDIDYLLYDGQSYIADSNASLNFTIA